jgi:hypothetical protein
MIGRKGDPPMGYEHILVAHFVEKRTPAFTGR